MHWYRFWLFWNTTDGLLAAATVGWTRDGSVAATNSGRCSPPTWRRSSPIVPTCLKVCRSTRRRRADRDRQRHLAQTLKQDHVHLTEDIREITPGGVITADGRNTGPTCSSTLRVSRPRFLTPMKMTGRHGVDLHGGGTATRDVLGIPSQFPNLFLLYGRTRTSWSAEHHHFSGARCATPWVPSAALPKGGHRALNSGGCPRCLQRANRRRQPSAGLGRLDRQQLVQEREGASVAELAFA